MAAPNKKMTQRPRDALLIKVKGPEKFILGSELEARKEGALHGWDYQSVLAAKALARLAFSDVGENMAAIDAVLESFLIDLKAVNLDDVGNAPEVAASTPTSPEEKAWHGLGMWFDVVHAFKASIGDALVSAVQADDQSRSEKGKLIKKRLGDAVNYLLATINVEKMPKPHGNVLLVKEAGPPVTYVPIVFATIQVFLDCARRLDRYSSKSELKKELARQYGDRTFQRKSSGTETGEMPPGPRISRLNERTWTKVLNEAGLKFIDQSKKGGRPARK